MILINAKHGEYLLEYVLRYGLLVILINAKRSSLNWYTSTRYGLLVILINAKLEKLIAVHLPDTDSW